MELNSGEPGVAEYDGWGNWHQEVAEDKLRPGTWKPCIDPAASSLGTYA